MTSKSYLVVAVAAVLVASATSAQSMPGWIFYDPYLQPPHHAVHCMVAVTAHHGAFPVHEAGHFAMSRMYRRLSRSGRVRRAANQWIAA